MTDGALRAPADRPAPRVNAPAAPAPVAAPRAVFTADTPAGAGDPAHRTQADFFAELATHGAATTPLCIGLFGPAGSGKSSLLRILLDRIGRVSAAAAEATDSPFVSGVSAVHVTVQPGLSPAASIVHQLFSALAPSYPRLVAEASHAGLDPRAAARDASDRLNEARHRLDAERAKLDEIAGRHARLSESVLFEAGGSRVDAYARANRSRIDRSLRRFGFDTDGGTAYRELVREASEPGGSLARGPGWARAFWAYRGQTRLIVVALAFFVLAWAVGLLIADQAPLIDAIRTSSDKMGGTADWLDAHAHWLQPIKETLYFAGIAALALNVLRGIRFLQPVVKGATLLRGDVDARRRDLDGHLAHQTHRVDSLAREAELASQLAAEAETRVVSGNVDGPLPRPAALTDGSLAIAKERDGARAFVAALVAAMAARTNDRLASSASAAPTRLVIGVDGFERVSSSEAASFLDTASALFDQPGIVTVVAADRGHLANGFGETDPALAASRLDRIVQVPFTIGNGEEPWPQSRSLVRALLGHGDTAPESPEGEPDIGRSALDTPWLQSEGAVLEALAPIAGSTPRAIKRFVNLYRVARADPRMRGANSQDLAALAVGLALQGAGSPVDPHNPAAYGGADDPALKARSAVGTALGAPFNMQEAGRGFQTARAYSAGL